MQGIICFYYGNVKTEVVPFTPTVNAGGITVANGFHIILFFFSIFVGVVPYQA